MAADRVTIRLPAALRRSAVKAAGGPGRLGAFVRDALLTHVAREHPTPDVDSLTAALPRPARVLVDRLAQQLDAQPERVLLEAIALLGHAHGLLPRPRPFSWRRRA